MSSMSAVWRGLGVASAKGPLEGTSIKEAKESIQWDVSQPLPGEAGLDGCSGV